MVEFLDYDLQQSTVPVVPIVVPPHMSRRDEPPRVPADGASENWLLESATVQSTSPRSARNKSSCRPCR